MSPPKVRRDYSEIAKPFESVAQRYFSLVDLRAKRGRTEFLIEVYRILPELMRAAMDLPDVRFRSRSTKRRRAFTHAKWSRLYHSLQKKFASYDLYWEIFDPRKHGKPIRASLADDIADIYRDLKRGSNCLKDDPAEAIFHWRFGFYTHWGMHAVDALRITQRLLEKHFID
jgi:hypothetical protein